MRVLTLSAIVLAASLLVSGGGSAEMKHASVSFAEDVYPVLQTRCMSCHQPSGEGFEKSGLDMRSYDSLMNGTKFGAVVVPGDAMTSNLMVLLDGRADKSLQMPHNKKKLSICDRDMIRTWINEGAQNN